ncbi:Pyridoxamine 5'-phosphate oxidase [Corynebacterium faecale]|uniref:pyridoxamine 5'-phosphate oxidase family protein n=1 Tax=Corynebacterium faecale TaxID=1758466 RepID=UPI0025B49E71|nr:pyridoxamine 5'-phosphate oxidase family protein [Corynebacterium faecale]WJY93022.1 Pyridoxamine 5'-phosphate oxidase [Corynebacterium faecale]
MSDLNGPVRKLTEQESRERLGAVALGRIVVRRSDDIEIFPVNYVMDEKNLYFRTAEGNKLFTISLNHDVLFEVDNVDEETAWSVVIRGNAELVRDGDEIQHVDSLDLKPWIPTLKYNYVRIAPDSITGREFQLGEEPERY